MRRYISPSILAADFGNLENEIRKINNSKASWLHCDVMDGSYVSTISFGSPIIKLAKKISTKPLDVHLMVVNPEKHIDHFCKLGADILTVHIEICANINKTFEQIKSYGVKAGISLNPQTPVSSLIDFVADADFVLVMSVDPGYGGQPFNEITYSRIAELKTMIHEKHSKAMIQVDGGITLDNAGKLFDCGVNILVSGTSVFHSPDPVKAVDQLLSV